MSNVGGVQKYPCRNCGKGIWVRNDEFGRISSCPACHQANVFWSTSVTMSSAPTGPHERGNAQEVLRSRVSELEGQLKEARELLELKMRSDQLEAALVKKHAQLQQLSPGDGSNGKNVRPDVQAPRRPISLTVVSSLALAYIASPFVLLFLSDDLDVGQFGFPEWFGLIVILPSFATVWIGLLCGRRWSLGCMYAYVAVWTIDKLLSFLIWPELVVTQRVLGLFIIPGVLLWFVSRPSWRAWVGAPVRQPKLLNTEEAKRLASQQDAVRERPSGSSFPAGPLP